MSPSFNQSGNCEGGDWGGFLQDKCCEKAFRGYLYILAEWANHTGKIYFDATEQRYCLVSLNKFENNTLSCGFERLTSGGGGCSEFSVSDVVNQFGGKLRSLQEDCKVLGYKSDSNNTCATCLKRWEDVQQSLAYSNEKSETELCRFAILVSMTSNRIEDKKWVPALYYCLGEQSADIEREDAFEKKKTRPAGLWLLVGGLAGVAIVIIIATWFLLRRRTTLKSRTKSFQKKDEMEETLPNDLNCQKISIKEIHLATNNLNALNFIGQGIAGKVYKGVLSNGHLVAVKHIINDGHMETFIREVTSLSHVRHPNLVALLGHCEEDDECFLVYEFCPYGNLSEWLFGMAPIFCKEKVLSWIQRIEIAIDSARGLWFLHDYPEGCIVHRDIKPTNILLGKNFEAKLSDFGLSKVIDVGQSYVSSEVRGTFGYVDPEYRQNHHVNSYGDVYSFGIVLLQLISGKRVMNLNLKKPMSLDKMAKFLTKGGSIAEFADPKLNGEYSTEAFDLILKLALSCTSHKQQRPTMEKVVLSLENALDISAKEKALSPSDTPPQV
ncbi:Receptor-like protein kinase [Thalictrum thalictroides]|uniref:Receptor-like protein kinase n=2 Tax=Thalictrum thalictroides TaxID=46969 RepID=A0A7J6VT27_THATH|nr:Receptor-like protein kinase [Thalictrum thalictroides]